MGNCCYSAKKRQISTPLGENILSKEYRNSSSDGSHHRQQLKKYLKQHQSFDLLATSKRSNWVQFRDKDEITSFKKGFCILVDEYLQIYSNEDALPKDLLDIISLRDGNVIDSIKNRIIINDQIVIDYESIEIKKLWLHDLMNEIEILNLEDKLKIFPMYVLEIQNNNLTSRQYATQFLLQKDDAIEYLSQEISVIKHYLLDVLGAHVHRSHERLLRLEHNPNSNSYSIIWHRPNHRRSSSTEETFHLDLLSHPPSSSHPVAHPHGETEKYIPLTTILEVNEGIHDSKLLKKFGLDANINFHCFSLVTSDSLGLGSPSEVGTMYLEHISTGQTRKYYNFQCHDQSIRDLWIFHLRNLLRFTMVMTKSLGNGPEDYEVTKL